MSRSTTRSISAVGCRTIRICASSRAISATPPKLAEALAGQDAVLHLACISNDASFELDEKLSETINYDCFEPMVIAAKKAGVKRFVYCSSSSVYGVSDSPDVTEDHPLVPLTLYNKFKGMCEPMLWKHKADDFTCVVIRPATVCGYSPRTRLDLSVNILTNHAVNKGTITVFGGNQMRPNLHVEDMVDAYLLMLDGAAREDPRRDLQYRLPEPFDRRDRQHGEKGGARKRCRRKATSRSSPRRPTTCAPITSIPTR